MAKAKLERTRVLIILSLALLPFPDPQKIVFHAESNFSGIKRPKQRFAEASTWYSRPCRPSLPAGSRGRLRLRLKNVVLSGEPLSGHCSAPQAHPSLQRPKARNREARSKQPRNLSSKKSELLTASGSFFFGALLTTPDPLTCRYHVPSVASTTYQYILFE